MKLPWRRKVSIILDDQFLESIIKSLLSDSKYFNYLSMFQEITLHLKIKDLHKVQRNIHEWLGGRV